MNDAEKLSIILTILGIDENEVKEVERIKVYLNVSEKEILSWRFSYAESMPDTVPAEYEMTQVYAVIAGYSQSGAENQTRHTENGISRAFRYEDMIAYIRAHVIPLCKVVS